MGKARAMAAACWLAGGCAATIPPLDHLPVQCEGPWRSEAAPPGPAEYIELLVRGYDPVRRTVTIPALDCTGAQVRWEGPALACADSSLAQTALSERPLGAGDVITSPVAERYTLLWIPTTRYAAGDAAGPVALVRAGEHRLEVAALGVLRAYPRGARLRLEVMGGLRVLVAEGEICAGEEAASCVRAARLVPLRQGRFAPEPLLDGDGRCQSPAWFDLARSEARRAEGRAARLDFSAALIFSPAGLTVDEQVVLQEVAGRSGGPPPRVLHRAQSSRAVQWREGRLVASGPSLWSRMAQER